MQQTNAITLADQLFDSLKRDIISGVYAVGGKLPSENKLAEQYGCSRITVRAALQQLRASGLIKTMTGAGSYVAEDQPKHMMDELAQRVLPQGTMEQTTEFRHVIDSACLRLTIKNASDAELDQLEQMALQYRKQLSSCNIRDDEALAALVDADFEFHFEICKLSKNPLFISSYLSTQNTIKEYIRAVLVFRTVVFRQLMNHLPDENDKHVPLAQAIKTRNVQQSIEIANSLSDFEFLPPELETYMQNNRKDGSDGMC